MRILQRAVIPPVQLAELASEVYELVPFTLDLIGFTSALQCNFQARVIGRMAHTRITGGVQGGSSNVNTFSIQTLPVALRPAVTQWCPVVADNNGSPIVALAQISSSGVITLHIGELNGANELAYTTTGWDAAATKGLRNGSIMWWQLD